jgi:hypothetical protein
METAELHIIAGWKVMLPGAVSGGFIGLLFHIDGWAGWLRYITLEHASIGAHLVLWDWVSQPHV